MHLTGPSGDTQKTKTHKKKEKNTLAHACKCGAQAQVQSPSAANLPTLEETPPQFPACLEVRALCLFFFFIVFEFFLVFFLVRAVFFWRSLYALV